MSLSFVCIGDSPVKYKKSTSSKEPRNNQIIDFLKQQTEERRNIEKEHHQEYMALFKELTGVLKKD